MKLNNVTLGVIFLCVITTSSNAQDWPNLKLYQKENAMLSTPKANENRIVFMGNSITEGWRNKRPEFFENSTYINRGIGGQTTPQMLLRFRQDVIDLQPKAVVILAGVNDLAENTGPSSINIIFGNIMSMAELAKANGIEVILCSVLPAYDFPWREGLEPAAKVVQLNKLIHQYALQNDMPYVDYFAPMANSVNGLKKDLGNDGIHPNKKGYLIMEPLVEKAINKVLIEK